MGDGVAEPVRDGEAANGAGAVGQFAQLAPDDHVAGQVNVSQDCEEAGLFPGFVRSKTRNVKGA